jgi:opacity protein-like surface antigen
MKTFVTVLALAALVASSAVAKTIKADTGNTFYSHAQGAQSYENPDRTYGSGNEPPAQ